MNEKPLSIGQVAKDTGLSVHALRFYESQDLLLRALPRSGAGRRIFTAKDVEWLRICIRLRESGMSVARLREFARLVRQGPGNEHQRLAVLRQHRDQVEERIRRLAECLDVIAGKVSTYEQHLAANRAQGLWDPSAADSRLCTSG